MSAQTVEQWEGSLNGFWMSISIDRIDKTSSETGYLVRFRRNGKQYESAPLQTANQARQRVDHAVTWSMTFESLTYKRVFHDEHLAPAALDEARVSRHRSNATVITSKLSMFLIVKTGSISGVWNGELRDAQQRDLFGAVVAKGMLSINGRRNVVQYQVCAKHPHIYGPHQITWNQLADN